MSNTTYKSPSFNGILFTINNDLILVMQDYIKIENLNDRTDKRIRWDDLINYIKTKGV